MSSPRYYHLAALLASIADELAEDHDLQDASGFFDYRRAHKLTSAAGYIQRAAELVLDCEPSPELEAAVQALQALCVCGRDLGDHMTEPPYPSEDGSCEGYRDASPTIPVTVPAEWMREDAANEGGAL